MHDDAVGDGGDAGDPTILRARLCLDFANTLNWRKSDRPEESLTGYAELLSWSKQAGAITEDEARTLLEEAETQPEQAETALEQAVTLREALYRIFSAVTEGLRPAESDLAIFNGVLSAALARLRLIPAPGGLVWGWAGTGGELDRMLWPTTRSAADLLTSGELSRVRRCAGDRCGWLFMDMSRNQSRRWCDMKDCGNRAKARRHYQRKKAGRAQAG